MSSNLANVLEEVADLTLEELITLQERITQQMRSKVTSVAPSASTSNGTEPPRRVKIPGSYRRTPQEIEASLAQIFTPQELARMGKTDFSKLSSGPKSASEMLNEDREDRV